MWRSLVLVVAQIALPALSGIYGYYVISSYGVLIGILGLVPICVLLMKLIPAINNWYFNDRS